MTCDTFRRQLAIWLSDELDAEEAGAAPPSELRDHARACDECAGRLRAARLSLEPAALRRSPPPDLAARVKARLRERHDRTRLAVRPAGRAARYAVAATLVAGALIAELSIGVGIGRERAIDAMAESAEVATGVVRIEFRLEAPDAARVAVVGDWNAWDAQANPLTDRDGDGVWEATITLLPGKEYQYQFLVDDDRWIPDPDSAIRVDDGFGGTNSVLNI